MTLGEIASFVCRKVGQLDSTSDGLCREFIKARHSMIYDCFPWVDSQVNANVTLPAGSNAVVLPTGISRVVAIRARGTAGGVTNDGEEHIDTGGAATSGYFLDPVNANLLIQTDPAIFDRTGSPTVYHEVTDLDNIRKIRIYPKPSINTPLLIAGKRTIRELESTDDEPLLRNVDQVLIAFAMGDMLERQRHYGKAELKFKEAAALLEAAKALETQQANLPRKSKQLTATQNSLNELTDEVCAKAGSFSLDTIILVKQFIRRAYQMIWDSYLWRETVTSVQVVAQNGVVTLPAEIDRPIAVRVKGGSALQPIEPALRFELDAYTGSAELGEPVGYEEVTVPGDFTLNRVVLRQLALYPAPEDGSIVSILGKRTVVPLADAVAPVLRNCSNALIAFAYSELLTSQEKDGSKAKEEGMAHVETMRKLQEDQTFKRRQTRRLSVAGNSLSEMVDAVCARCGAFDIESMIFAADSLRRAYQMAYDAALWPESTVIVRMESDGGQIILPEYVDTVTDIRANAGDFPLMNVQTSTLFGIAPSIFEETNGRALGFTRMAPVAVAVLPAATEKLSFVSSNANDKQKVFVRGESSGNELSETVTLNGEKDVETVNAYDTPLTIAKPVTAGDVTISGVDSEVRLQMIPANERERKHVRLWLNPSGSATSCLILGKRRIKPLVTDEDTPLLPKIGNALIAAAAADMFAKLGNDKAAADQREKADSAIKILVDVETNQSAFSPQIIPDVSGYYNDYPCEGSWIVAK
jgi:hypothetical protein